MAGFLWGGPRWNELDFAGNCSAFGHYAAWIVTEGNEPTFPVVASLWRAVVPEVQSVQPNNGQIIDWHEWVRSNMTTLAKEMDGISVCRSELCRTLGSEIDGGLAGFGVLASYGLEAVLLSIYAAFTILSSFKRQGSSTTLYEKPQAVYLDDKLSIFNRINEALRGTTYEFFAAAASLSLGIQATVIYNQISPVASRYNSSLQLIFSAFPFYALATMLPLILASDRRSWLKGSVLGLLFVVQTTAWVLCIINNAQMDYYHNERAIDLCPKNHPPEAAVGAAMFTMAAMIWMPPLFGICLSLILCFYRCNNRKMWQAEGLNKVAKGAMVLYAGANFICMWGAWIFLVVFFNGATSQTDNTWNLGQALALTPWITVLVEIGSILFFGTEATFVGRLSFEFKVIRKERALHHRERDAILDEMSDHSDHQVGVGIR
ncbi:hypothetical protein CMUS01_01630 [Colletotrichum musicola]|uniref:Uncharacterized protein n=1 Tax=Colletotrichum musicola TaxID=2175873 RepID=A0A8H6NWQ3_9PEZI|nr:hypothetical protein CMUS01_01630 [Colletotrichum musicola]